MEVIDLAEEVVAMYSLRSYRAAYRRGMVCGCRHCQGEMKRWQEWAVDDGDVVSDLLATNGLDYSMRPTATRDGSWE